MNGQPSAAIDAMKTGLMIEISKSRKRWHNLLGILRYHVEPKQGFNDPNGFSTFDGKCLPKLPLVQPMGWSLGQLESDDLVHFTETGDKVLPDNSSDTATVLTLFCHAVWRSVVLFYTGNVRDETGSVTPTRLVLWWIRMGKEDYKDWLGSWLTSQQTLLTTSAIRNQL